MNNISKNWKSIFVYALIFILLIGGVIYAGNQQNTVKTKYSEVVQTFTNCQVKDFTLNLSSGALTYYTFEEPEKQQTYSVPNVAYFLEDVREPIENYNLMHADNPITYDYVKGSSNSWLLSMLPSVLLTVGLIVLSVYMIRKMSGAMNSETNRTLGFGKIRAKSLVDDEKKNTTLMMLLVVTRKKASLKNLLIF